MFEKSIGFICAIVLSGLLVAGCSGSSESSSPENENANIGDSATPIAADTTTSQPPARPSPTETSSSPGVVNSSSTTIDDIEESPENLTEIPTLEFTRVVFDISVPVYVSNALQVRLTWGDKNLIGRWVTDESWIVEDDFPVNTENQLVVTFNDDNGAVTLASFETGFRTGIQESETINIAASQFDTARWDSDEDGFSNLDELLAGTNPQAPDAPVAVPATLELLPDKTVRLAWQSSPRADYYRVLENPDGLSEFMLISDDLDVTTLQFDYRIPIHKRLNALYRVQACNTIGCTDTSLQPFDVVALALEMDGALTRIRPDILDEGDGFGSPLALSTDAQTLVVGSPREASAATGVNGDQLDNSASESISNAVLGGTGAAYVFARIDGSWQQQAYLKASNTGESDHFGTALSISADGNTVAVGAYGESSLSTGIDGNQEDNSGHRAGAVYVYTRDSGVWTQQAYVKASNTQEDNYFGRAVSLSADGNTLAVGAHDEKNDSTEIDGDQTQGTTSNTGAIYMYSRQNSLWTQQAYLKAGLEVEDSRCCFGGLGRVVSLSADGKTVVAGMQYRSERAVVFTQINGSWQQTAILESPNRQLDGDFGEKLSLSADGKTLAITAVGEQPKDEQRELIDSTAEGVAYVYVLADDGWQQQAYFYLDDLRNGRKFGRSVSLSGDGNTLLIGFNADRLYLSTRSAGLWSELKTLFDPATEVATSFRVYSPSLSGDGNTLVTVGSSNDPATFGVYVF